MMWSSSFEKSLKSVFNLRYHETVCEGHKSEGIHVAVGAGRRA